MRSLALMGLVAVSVVCTACATSPSDSPAPEDRSLTITEYAESLEVSQNEVERSESDEDAARARLQRSDPTPFTGLPDSGSEACTATMAFLDQRERSAEAAGDTLWTRERAAEEVIASISTIPDFTDASRSHQTEIVEGIRSAAAGNC